MLKPIIVSHHFDVEGEYTHTEVEFEGEGAVDYLDDILQQEVVEGVKTYLGTSYSRDDSYKELFVEWCK